MNDHDNSQLTVLVDRCQQAQDKARRYEVILDHLLGLLWPIDKDDFHSLQSSARKERYAK